MASACINNGTLSQEFPAYGCFNPRASFSLEDAPSSESAAEEAVLGAEVLSDGRIDNSKAPRCSSSRWRELLGLKRFSQNSKAASTTPPSNLRSSTSSSLKQFLHRSSRSSSGISSSDDPVLSLPLLKESDCGSLSRSSSRLSLSSSSSSHDHEDLPRLSLDAERPANPFAPARSLNQNPPRMRLVGRAETSQTVSVDSPRLNSSGKIVFQNLGRSSSSPSSFNGGYRQRGNVRVNPVLNVPVCSIRGGSVVFGQFFSSSSSYQSQQNRTTERRLVTKEAIRKQQ